MRRSDKDHISSLHVSRKKRLSCIVFTIVACGKSARYIKKWTLWSLSDGLIQLQIACFALICLNINTVCTKKKNCKGCIDIVPLQCFHFLNSKTVQFLFRADTHSIIPLVSLPNVLSKKKKKKRKALYNFMSRDLIVMSKVTIVVWSTFLFKPLFPVLARCV